MSPREVRFQKRRHVDDQKIIVRSLRKKLRNNSHNLPCRQKMGIRIVPSCVGAACEECRQNVRANLDSAEEGRVCWPCYAVLLLQLASALLILTQDSVPNILQYLDLTAARSLHILQSSKYNEKRRSQTKGFRSAFTQRTMAHCRLAPRSEPRATDSCAIG